ncbi:MAG: PEPxxWA-CTERM sorting domain-containing protein [Thermaurantiacus sp.]
MSLSFTRVVAFSALLLSTPSMASVTIGDTPPTNPPVGVGPVNVDITTSAGGGSFDWSQNQAGPGFTYQADSYQLVISNIFAPQNTKYVLLRFEFTPGIIDLLPPVGSPVGDSPFFPSLHAAGDVVLRAASILSGPQIAMQWTIRPQPSQETVDFSRFPDIGGIFRIWVDTICVPEPQTWAMMIIGFGAVGGAIRRKRARETKDVLA